MTKAKTTFHYLNIFYILSFFSRAILFLDCFSINYGFITRSCSANEINSSRQCPISIPPVNVRKPLDLRKYPKKMRNITYSNLGLKPENKYL